MTKGKINIWIFLIIVLQALPSMAMAANSFFDQRYRGWLWFEEKEVEGDSKGNLSIQNDETAEEEITVEEAKAEVEGVTKGLCRICKCSWSKISKSHISGVMMPSTF